MYKRQAYHVCDKKKCAVGKAKHFNSFKCYRKGECKVYACKDKRSKEHGQHCLLYTSAEGYNAVASGFYSHAGGIHSEAKAEASFAHGEYAAVSYTHLDVYKRQAR